MITLLVRKAFKIFEFQIKKSFVGQSRFSQVGCIFNLEKRKIHNKGYKNKCKNMGIS